MLPRQSDVYSVGELQTKCKEHDLFINVKGHIYQIYRVVFSHFIGAHAKFNIECGEPTDTWMTPEFEPIKNLRVDFVWEGLSPSAMIYMADPPSSTPTGAEIIGGEANGKDA